MLVILFGIFYVLLVLRIDELVAHLSDLFVEILGLIFHGLLHLIVLLLHRLFEIGELLQRVSFDSFPSIEATSFNAIEPRASLHTEVVEALHHLPAEEVVDLLEFFIKCLPNQPHIGLVFSCIYVALLFIYAWRDHEEVLLVAGTGLLGESLATRQVSFAELATAEAAHTLHYLHQGRVL